MLPKSSIAVCYTQKIMLNYSIHISKVMLFEDSYLKYWVEDEKIEKVLYVSSKWRNAEIHFGRSLQYKNILMDYYATENSKAFYKTTTEAHADKCSMLLSIYSNVVSM